MKFHSIDKFLYKLNERFDVDLRYFLTGGLWLSIPFIVNYLLGILRSVAFARLTEKDVYGQFSFVKSAANIFIVLTLPGINIALVETVARGNDGSTIIAAKEKARWGLLASLAMLAVALYYYFQGETELVLAIVIAGVLMPIVSSLQVGLAYYSGKKRFDITSQIMIVYSVVNTLSILFVLYIGGNLVLLVFANYISQLLLYTLVYLYTSRKIRDLPVDDEIISYGKSLTWAGSINLIAMEIDRIIIGFSIGFVNLAVYQIALIIPESLRGLMRILMPLTLPKIAEKPDKKVYTARTRRLLLYLLFLNLLIILAAILLLPLVINLLYGEIYASSIRLSQMLMLTLAFGLPSNFFGSALQARKQTRAIYNANLIMGTLQLGIMILLIPWLGLMGAVISRIVSRWATAFYQWYAVRKI